MNKIKLTAIYMKYRSKSNQELENMISKYVLKYNISENDAVDLGLVYTALVEKTIQENRKN
jgi:hypothetical protein